MVACRCVPFPVSLPFFPFISIGRSSSRNWDSKGAGTSGYACARLRGRLVCAALGLAPAMSVDEVPLHAALRCCAVVVRVLLLGV
jgi:hypothetical protein